MGTIVEQNKQLPEQNKLQIQAINDLRDFLDSRLPENVGYTIKYTTDITTTDDEECKRRELRDRNNNVWTLEDSTIEGPQKVKYDSALKELKQSPRFNNASLWQHDTNFQENYRPIESYSTRDVSEKQEYYKHRDALQGKPMAGKNNYMTHSWPHDLNNIAEWYSRQQRKEPYEYKYGGSRLGPGFSTTSLIPVNRVPVFEPLCEKKEVFPLGSSENIHSSQSKLSKSQTLGSGGPINIFDRGFRINNLDDSKVRQICDEISRRIPVKITTKYGVLSLIGVGSIFLEGQAIGGPPCHLCYKAIREKRCIVAKESQYHCWHFLCSFCLKILKEDAFFIGSNQMPYCNRICYERTYPPDNNYIRF